jgi:hypothetical protein
MMGLSARTDFPFFLSGRRKQDDVRTE